MAKKTRQPGAGAPALQANVAELRALAHPLRLRILELFAEAPRTTKQVADLLGQPPTRLYHHVAALERAGLLQLKETRKNRGTVEKWYEAASRTMGSWPNASKIGGNLVGRRAMAMTVLEQSRREVVNAMAASGPAPLLARLVMVGPPELMPKVRERLSEFIKTIQKEYNCDDAPDDTTRERWSMTMTFAPVWPRK